MSEELELYQELAMLGVYFTGLWAAAWGCSAIKLSPVVGQILFGILMGPNGLSLVPLFDGFEEIQEQLDKNEDNENVSAINGTDFGVAGEARLENYLVILGNLGVTFLIFESGLHVDFDMLKKVGPSAFMVATLGTVFSIIFGMAMSEPFGFGAYPEGLAIGAVIAPTSVGLALKLLHDANVLDSSFGQTIVTAAFTDDIFSLITLAVLIELAGGDFSVFSVLKPLFASGTFIAVGFLSALYVFPQTMPMILNPIYRKFGQSSRDRIQLSLIFVLMAGFGYVGTLVGSHLLGAFLAGVATSKVPRTDAIWNEYLAKPNEWLVALFFGATVAFAVPVKEMLDIEIFWKGAILGGFTVLAKILSGLPLKHRWVIGWAMVGRGEFSFIVGEIMERTEFQDSGDAFLSVEGFGVAVWALMIAIFIAPIAFGCVLAQQIARDEQEEAELDHFIGDGPGSKVVGPPRNSAIIPNPGQQQRRRASTTTSRNRFSQVASILFQDKKGGMRSQYTLTVKTDYQQGLIRDIMTIFEDLDIHVLSFINDGDLKTTLMTFTILVTDPSAEPIEAGMGSTNKDNRSAVTKKSHKFKNKYFAFDMDRYLDKLTARIKNSLNTESEVRVERQQGYGGRPGSSVMQRSTVVQSAAKKSRFQSVEMRKDSEEGEGDLSKITM